MKRENPTVLSADAATDVDFDADGTTLRGWLYRPRGRAAAAPAVVMAHGYNCIKELYLYRYAASVAKAGHIVLAYDHRNFGDSDGEPRQELDPWLQVRDYRNAITFVQMLEGVDPERIGIWGTSYAGGHVLVVAAIDRRVRCVVSQSTDNQWMAIDAATHRATGVTRSAQSMGGGPSGALQR